jgi:riboflavin-specific deaminase-like protein
MMITSKGATPAYSGSALGEATAWQLLQALATRASRGTPVLEGTGIALDSQGALWLGPAQDGWIVARPSVACGFEPNVPLSDAAHQMLKLYAPLCVGAHSRVLVLAHLGQSLDGRVATVTGSSRFVTGPEDLRHMHRLRALFDAVLVGAQTAQLDDPELTTRLVPGAQPTRVVLDPQGRLSPSLRLLCDGPAKTILVKAHGGPARAFDFPAHVEIMEIPIEAGTFALNELLDGLRQRGLSRVFIEGGGFTVSRFLQGALLDRLHLTVAPKIIGSGTLALQLDPIQHMRDALNPRARRFVLGEDLLFDCDLRSHGD